MADGESEDHYGAYEEMERVSITYGTYEDMERASIIYGAHKDLLSISRSLLFLLPSGKKPRASD